MLDSFDVANILNTSDIYCVSTKKATGFYSVAYDFKSGYLRRFGFVFIPKKPRFRLRGHDIFIHRWSN